MISYCSIRSVFLNIKARINDNFTELNENDKEVLSYILENKSKVKKTTIKKLAEQTLTSKSSIMRLTKKLGYSGYSELKYELQSEKDYNIEDIEGSFYSAQNTEIENTKKLFNQMNTLPIVKKIYESRRVFCYGTGWGQRDVISNFQRSMLALNKYLISINSSTELKIAAEQMTANDLVVIVSLSGDIKESETAIEALIIRDIPILSITNLNNNEYASVSEYNLYCRIGSVIYDNREINSLLPLYVVTDLLFREYTEYVIGLEK